jgi:hypothetical protein
LCITCSRALGPVELPLDSFIGQVFAADGNNVYSVIASMPKGGGAWVPLSRSDDQLEGGPDPPTRQDETNLFMIVDGGAIVMLPKTPIGPIS